MTAPPAATSGGLWFLPGDAPGWERAVIYLVLGGVLLLIAKTASMGLMSLLDGSLGASAGRPPSPRTKDARLTLGTLPSGEALVAAGYLRAGAEGAADAILATAASEGWVLSGDLPGMLSLFDVPASASLRSAKLRVKLRAAESSMLDARAAAMTLARDEAARLEEALLEQGLLRGTGASFVGVVTHFAISVGIVAIGVTEASFASGRGDVAAIPLAIAALFAAVALATARPDRRSHAGMRYLGWLEGATMSVARDVEDARSTRPGDLALVGAVAGSARLPIFRKCLDETRALAD